MADSRNKYWLVLDNDFENAEEFASLSYAILAVIVAWHSDNFFSENFKSLLNGEIITCRESDYQLFTHEEYVTELSDLDEEEDVS